MRPLVLQKFHDASGTYLVSKGHDTYPPSSAHYIIDISVVALDIGH